MIIEVGKKYILKTGKIVEFKKTSLENNTPVFYYSDNEQFNKDRMFWNCYGQCLSNQKYDVLKEYIQASEKNSINSENILEIEITTNSDIINELICELLSIKVEHRENQKFVLDLVNKLEILKKR